VIAAHSFDNCFWEEGGIATTGVEEVAETGGTSSLENELKAVSPEVDYVVGRAQFNSMTQEQSFDLVRMSPTNKFLTTISMIAPSPDWFTGFYDFSPVNDLTKTWYSEFVIETYPWDAGTEDGDTFSGANGATDPREPIFRFTSANTPSNGILLNSAGNDVLPMASWTCSILDSCFAEEDKGPDCFSSSVSAFVKGRGNVPMSDVVVGDHVLTGNGDFEPIYTIDHRHPTKEATFYQIHYKSAKQNNMEQQQYIEITRNHMIFLSGKTNPVPAKNIKIGDRIQTVDGPAPVTKITTIAGKGVFNPLTTDGTIVANGVISSTYSTVASDSESIEILGYQFISYHGFFKNLLQPVSFFCTTTSLEMCKTQREKILISEYASKLFFSSQNRYYQTLFLFFSLIFSSMLNKFIIMIFVHGTIVWMMAKRNDKVLGK